MTFDSMLADIRKREMAEGQRNVDAAIARQNSDAQARHSAELATRAQKLDCSSYIREMDVRAREIGAEPMRLRDGKIDVSANVLRADDFELISANREKIIAILEARAQRTLL